MSEVQEKVASSIVTSENLAEFQATRLGLATKEAAPPAETSSEPEVVDEAKEQETQEEPQNEEPPKKPNPKLERRFSDLTKQREQARQEAAEERRKREELEQRIRDLEGRSKPPAQQDEDAKPSPDQFSDAFEYAEKLSQWSTRQALKERDKQESERRAAEQRDKLIKSWQTKLQAAKTEMPDFDEMVASSDVKVSDPIRDAIIESDVGPKLLYHFAENPEIAEKLNGMSVASALRELGKIEAKFEKAEKETVKPVSRPRAAAPINPIRSVAAGVESGVDTDGEFRGSFADYRAMRKAGKIR